MQSLLGGTARYIRTTSVPTEELGVLLADVSRLLASVTMQPYGSGAYQRRDVDPATLEVCNLPTRTLRERREVDSDATIVRLCRRYCGNVASAGRTQRPTVLAVPNCNCWRLCTMMTRRHIGPMRAGLLSRDVLQQFPPVGFAFVRRERTTVG